MPVIGHVFLDFNSIVFEQLSGLRERPSLVGSLAGAAHLLNDNTGVLEELNENRNLM